jgi:acetoacetate decarboxylase
MVGQLWMSLFRLAVPVGPPEHGLRPAGVYGVAFVNYEPGSPLTYSELLVARPIRSDEHGRRVSISDIWVDSSASVAGGRELWAIPKELCDFEFESVRRGPLSTTEWSTSVGRRPIASARFTDVSKAMLRLPFKGGTWQPGIDDTFGEERTAALQGSSKPLPCRGHWDFAADGPLGWLRGARQLGSVRMADFRMSFA